MLFEIEGFQPLEVAAQPVRVVGAHAVRADLCGVSEVVEVLNLPHPDFKTRVLDFADKFPVYLAVIAERHLRDPARFAVEIILSGECFSGL